MTIAEKLANARIEYRPVVLKGRGRTVVWLLAHPGERREEMLRLARGEQIRHMPDGGILVRAK